MFQRNPLSSSPSFIFVIFNMYSKGPNSDGVYSTGWRI